MIYKNNPNLKTIKDNYLGTKYLDGRFLNYQKVKAPSLKTILKWQFGDRPNKRLNKANLFAREIVPFCGINDTHLDKIVWLGHASFLITINGKNILTDPVFFNIPMVKRRARLPLPIESMVNNIDYILVSHSHYDHLDKKTLQVLCRQNPNAILYCGLNHENLFRKYKIKNRVVEAAWYQQFPINEDGVKIDFLPSLHWSKRTLKDRNIRLWGSFMVSYNEKRVYFMGDSGYSPHFKEIGELYSGVDYCILGVGAYEPREIMESSHIKPEEAVLAFHDLKGKNLVPMHYGTFCLTDELMTEPLERITGLNPKIHGNLLTVKIGEVIEINE